MYRARLYCVARARRTFGVPFGFVSRRVGATTCWPWKSATTRDGRCLKSVDAHFIYYREIAASRSGVFTPATRRVGRTPDLRDIPVAFRSFRRNATLFLPSNGESDARFRRCALSSRRCCPPLAVRRESVVFRACLPPVNFNVRREAPVFDRGAAISQATR